MVFQFPFDINQNGIPEFWATPPSCEAAKAEEYKELGLPPPGKGGKGGKGRLSRLVTRLPHDQTEAHMSMSGAKGKFGAKGKAGIFARMQVEAEILSRCRLAEHLV